jgi:ComF family protein
MGFLFTVANIVLDALFSKSEVEQQIRELSEPHFLSLMRPIEYKDGVVSLFRYENPLIHEMVHALKYRGNATCATLFAKALVRYIESEQLQHCYLIPAPLAPRRKAERGHNQIVLVLNKLPDQYNTLHDVLLKVRNTKPQTSLKRKDRMRNLVGAFTIQHAEKIAGKTIILIDDVTTTGTTLKECSSCLLQAGAKKVYRVAFAR